MGINEAPSIETPLHHIQGLPGNHFSLLGVGDDSQLRVNLQASLLIRSRLFRNIGRRVLGWNAT
ncbi:uncharacterized protein DS421_20g687340 [Arachis hypogaea]|nr:uncharacterized protein DS421_20g687340 [Arachis hypogaea]